MAQVVDCLPSKHEALSLNPNTVKKNNFTFLVFFLSFGGMRI
jgi:hypothetical protein